jgi:uncharacterized membrane protein
MFGLGTIIELVKTAFGYFTNRQESKEALDAKNSEQQNEITLEETRKNSFTWRQALGYVLTFIVAWNYIVIPILGVCFGVVLPPIPLQDVWRVLIMLIGGS